MPVHKCLYYSVYYVIIITSNVKKNPSQLPAYTVMVCSVERTPRKTSQGLGRSSLF